MTADRATPFARLEELGIAATTVDHEPMFTVEQSFALRASLPGAHTKNLFLINKEGRMVLVVAKDERGSTSRRLPPGSAPDASASVRASCSKLCSALRRARSRRSR